MKNITAMFCVGALLITSGALAHDLTYNGPLKTRETKSVRVELPAGKMTVEVFSTSKNTKFNCQFAYTYGGFVLEQLNSNRCLGNFVMATDSTMVVSISNTGAESDYKIWVHDTK